MLPQWADQDPRTGLLWILETSGMACGETISEFRIVDLRHLQLEVGHLFVLGLVMKQYRETHSWECGMLELWQLGLETGEGWGVQVLQGSVVGRSGELSTPHLSCLEQILIY